MTYLISSIHSSPFFNPIDNIMNLILLLQVLGHSFYPMDRKLWVLESTGFFQSDNDITTPPINVNKKTDTLIKVICVFARIIPQNFDHFLSCLVNTIYFFSLIFILVILLWYFFSFSDTYYKKFSIVFFYFPLCITRILYVPIISLFVQFCEGYTTYVDNLHFIFSILTVIFGIGANYLYCLITFSFPLISTSSGLSWSRIDFYFLQFYYIILILSDHLVQKIENNACKIAIFALLAIFHLIVTGLFMSLIVVDSVLFQVFKLSVYFFPFITNVIFAINVSYNLTGEKLIFLSVVAYFCFNPILFFLLERSKNRAQKIAEQYLADKDDSILLKFQSRKLMQIIAIIFPQLDDFDQNKVLSDGNSHRHHRHKHHHLHQHKHLLTAAQSSALTTENGTSTNENEALTTENGTFTNENEIITDFVVENETELFKDNQHDKTKTDPNFSFNEIILDDDDTYGNNNFLKFQNEGNGQNLIYNKNNNLINDAAVEVQLLKEEEEEYENENVADLGNINANIVKADNDYNKFFSEQKCEKFDCWRIFEKYLALYPLSFEFLYFYARFLILRPYKIDSLRWVLKRMKKLQGFDFNKNLQRSFIQLILIQYESDPLDRYKYLGKISNYLLNDYFLSLKMFWTEILMSNYKRLISLSVAVSNSFNRILDTFSLNLMNKYQTKKLWKICCINDNILRDSLAKTILQTLSKGNSFNNKPISDFLKKRGQSYPSRKRELFEKDNVEKNILIFQHFSLYLPFYFAIICLISFIGFLIYGNKQYYSDTIDAYLQFTHLINYFTICESLIPYIVLAEKNLINRTYISSQINNNYLFQTKLMDPRVDALTALNKTIKIFNKIKSKINSSYNRNVLDSYYIMPTIYLDNQSSWRTNFTFFPMMEIALCRRDLHLKYNLEELEEFIGTTSNSFNFLSIYHNALSLIECISMFLEFCSTNSSYLMEEKIETLLIKYQIIFFTVAVILFALSVVCLCILMSLYHHFFLCLIALPKNEISSLISNLSCFDNQSFLSQFDFKIKYNMNLLSYDAPPSSFWPIKKIFISLIFGNFFLFLVFCLLLIPLKATYLADFNVPYENMKKMIFNAICMPYMFGMMYLAPQISYLIQAPGNEYKKCKISEDNINLGINKNLNMNTSDIHKNILNYANNSVNLSDDEVQRLIFEYSLETLSNITKKSYETFLPLLTDFNKIPPLLLNDIQNSNGANSYTIANSFQLMATSMFFFLREINENNCSSIKFEEGIGQIFQFVSNESPYFVKNFEKRINEHNSKTLDYHAFRASLYFLAIVVLYCLYDTFMKRIKNLTCFTHSILSSIPLSISSIPENNVVENSKVHNYFFIVDSVFSSINKFVFLCDSMNYIVATTTEAVSFFQLEQIALNLNSASQSNNGTKQNKSESSNNKNHHLNNKSNNKNKNKNSKSNEIINKIEKTDSFYDDNEKTNKNQYEKMILDFKNNNSFEGVLSFTDFLNCIEKYPMDLSNILPPPPFQAKTSNSNNKEDENENEYEVYYNTETISTSNLNEDTNNNSINNNSNNININDYLNSNNFNNNDTNIMNNSNSTQNLGSLNSKVELKKNHYEFHIDAKVPFVTSPIGHDAFLQVEVFPVKLSCSHDDVSSTAVYAAVIEDITLSQTQIAVLNEEANKVRMLMAQLVPWQIAPTILTAQSHQPKVLPRLALATFLVEGVVAEEIVTIQNIIQNGLVMFPNLTFVGRSTQIFRLVSSVFADDQQSAHALDYYADILIKFAQYFLHEIHNLNSNKNQTNQTDQTNQTNQQNQQNKQQSSQNNPNLSYFQSASQSLFAQSTMNPVPSPNQNLNTTRNSNLSLNMNTILNPGFMQAPAQTTTQLAASGTWRSSPQATIAAGIYDGNEVAVCCGIDLNGPYFTSVISDSPPFFSIVGEDLDTSSLICFHCRRNQINISRSVYEAVFDLNYQILFENEIVRPDQKVVQVYKVVGEEVR